MAAFDWLVESLSGRDAMMQCGMFLIPRCLLDEAGGWDERLSLVDDFEFFVRVLLKADDLLFCPGFLSYRSGLSNALSGRRTPEALESAVFSMELGTEAILRREDSPRTRRLSADHLAALGFDVYLTRPDLARRLRRRATALGGSDVRPPGGSVFRRLSHIVGWRAALRLRSCILGTARRRRRGMRFRRRGAAALEGGGP
jgi:hypothetical protein